MVRMVVALVYSHSIFQVVSIQDYCQKFWCVILSTTSVFSCHAGGAGCTLHVATDAFTRNTQDAQPRTAISVDLFDLKENIYTVLPPLVQSVVSSSQPACKRCLYRTGNLSNTVPPAISSTLPEGKWEANGHQIFDSVSLLERALPLWRRSVRCLTQ